MDFQPHELVWTEEKTRRFWDWMSNEPAYEGQYFSRLWGEAIIDYAVRRGNLPKSRAVLDFGCGPGDLLKKLLHRGIACSGAEFSLGTIQKANSNIGSHPRFRGITHIEKFPLPQPDESFDFIFLIETVEHLTPEALDSTIREIHRLLRPGGQLMITTPHHEDLLGNKILCPDCGAMFHGMQHLRSWTEASLRAEIEPKGFGTVICEATTLLNPGIERLVIRFLRTVKWRMLRMPLKYDNLVYIGKKWAAE